MRKMPKWRMRPSALLPCHDDDDTFPVANDIDDNGDDGEDASTLDQEAERIAKAQARIRTRSRYDFSTANLKKTAPLYKNDLFRLEDDNEQPLMCEMGSLHREAAIHFIDTMKRKPDGFWLDESVTASAAEAFWFHLPPRVLTEGGEAFHIEYCGLTRRSWRCFASRDRR